MPETPSKPQCWDHGCNSRQLSTFSNLLRHQREKSGSSTKSVCHRCGAEFTRKTARDGHLARDKCKQRDSGRLAPGESKRGPKRRRSLEEDGEGEEDLAAGKKQSRLNQQQDTSTALYSIRNAALAEPIRAARLAGVADEGSPLWGPPMKGKTASVVDELVALWTFSSC